MIYTFKCECGYLTDIERSIHSEVEEPMCPNCTNSMYRIWQVPAITFKGSGFYSTDNR